MARFKHHIAEHSSHHWSRPLYIVQWSRHLGCLTQSGHTFLSSTNIPKNDTQGVSRHVHGKKPHQTLETMCGGNHRQRVSIYAIHSPSSCVVSSEGLRLAFLRARHLSMRLNVKQATPNNICLRL
ncbi:hypothetical protein PoB_001923100 [Plakobranchus ocellatus]|uniref:Uncharacterized protein n=1 Tax=Plakobranchus ocellatus TaxID=259542 RepID=A0AAV3ZDL0_9GAST|nr:hypothetical protein PoB_001923100 [Plakobranchus ocellatus]